MKRIGKNKWQFTVPGPGTISVDIEVEATDKGIEIDLELLPWSEIAHPEVERLEARIEELERTISDYRR